MSSDQEYRLGEDYPPPGKRRSNFVGHVERDDTEEGWVWVYEKEKKEKKKK